MPEMRKREGHDGEEMLEDVVLEEATPTTSDKEDRGEYICVCGEEAM